MTQKALAATRTMVNPLEVIKILQEQIGQGRIIVAGVRKNGKQFSGELLTITRSRKELEVDNDGFVDVIGFEDIETIEQTN